MTLKSNTFIHGYATGSLLAAAAWFGTVAQHWPSALFFALAGAAMVFDFVRGIRS